MSCGCGKKKCNGKCGISPSVLQINNNECTLFHKVEIPAVMGDETTNPPKTGAYRNVLLYYEASGNSYLYSSDGIPTKLTGVVSDYEVLTNKPSINGVVLIKNKTLADLGIISAIDSAVADEATARENADNALSDRITTNANNIAANATAISNEVTARTNADNTLSAHISGNTTAINNEKTARENADAGLQDQITAVKATADSAVQPDDIDKTVMSDLAVDSNSSTAQVILKESKVNLKTGATSSEQTSLPVASSSQAGVMNSATYDAVTSNTSNINAIMNGAVAITGLPANPSQSDLTTAWQNETGLSTLINRASVYDVTNNKVWTYYTNDTTWHVASNTSQVTVNTFTNSSEGTIKGSTNIGQVFAENDGTGSVNGWGALSDAVSNNTSKLAGIESGAEVNVQSDWNVSDSSSDAYIKNKPTIGNGTLTIQKNGTTIDTFTANSTTNKTVNITVPTVNDATLTIQKNGDTVQTFTANSSSNKTANIEVPTKTSELDNDAGFIANDTTEICDEGSDITLNGTLLEPLDVKKIEGATSQQTYSGKNLLDSDISNVSQTQNSTAEASGNGIKVTGNSTEGLHYATLKIANIDRILGQQVSISCKYSGTSPRVAIYYVNSSGIATDYLGDLTASSGTASKTITMPGTLGNYDGIALVLYTGTNANATFTDMQIEKSASATVYEPYVGGVPAPNPDYPQAVRVVTGENVVQICGKNLFSVENYSGTSSAVDVSISDNVISLNGTTSQSWGFNIKGGSNAFALPLEAGSYAVSLNKAVNFPIELNIKKSDGYTLAIAEIPAGSLSTTVTINERAVYYTLWSNTALGTVINVSNFSIQLEKGSSASSFEPYQEQSYEVNLGNIELCKIGDYQDYIYKDGSDWKIHKAIKKLTLNGSESYVSYAASGFTAFYLDAADAVGGSASDNPILSSAFKSAYANADGNIYLRPSPRQVVICTSVASTAANWQTWLASNPVTVYYALATPTDTEITNEALVTQLNALWEADGYDSQTNITLTYAEGNAQGILSVCQYPSHLPIATKTKLGTIVVGHGLDIEADGKLDVIVDDDFSTESEHPVQNKIITNALAGKADNTDLSTVAMTGSYDDLTGKPTIPTVNNATLTIQKNGTNVATFTANSSTNVTANITAPVVTMTTTDPGEGGALAANNFIGVYV